MPTEHSPQPPVSEMSDTTRASMAPTQPAPAQQPQQQQPYQQPYIPYAPTHGQPVQSYPQYSYTQPTIDAVHESKAWSSTKFGLHVTAIVLCIIGLGVGLSLVNANNDAWIFFIASTPLFAVVICWDAAELITRCTRKFKAGIHPGAHVGVSLFIWLAAAIVGGMLAAVSTFYDSSCYYSSYSYEYDSCDSDNGKRPEVVVITVAMCLLWAVHFAIFVIACVDTHRRNNAKMHAPIMVYQQPPYWATGQGYAPVQQYYVSQPGQQPMGPPQQAQYAPVPTQAHDPNGKTVNHSSGVQGPVQHEQVYTSPQSNPNPNVTEYYTPSGAAA